MTDACMLVIARETDPVIEALRRHSSRVMHASVADLCKEGWRYVAGRADLATARATERIVAANDCAAVLCRVAAVVSDDLPWMNEDDRSYAAAELNAFLHAWLSQFRGVRCNEPTWMSLAGAGWHELQARAIVSKLGIPVSPTGRGATMTAKVIGNKVFGVLDPLVCSYAKRIARVFESRVLSIRFAFGGDWTFHSVDSQPTLDNAEASALLDAAFPSLENHGESLAPILEMHG